MKIRIALILAFSLFSGVLRAEKISLVGATVINPVDDKVLPNATVVINGDKIERVAMGKQDAATLGKQISSFNRGIYSHAQTAPILPAFVRIRTRSPGSNCTSTTSSRATFAAA